MSRASCLRAHAVRCLSFVLFFAVSAQLVAQETKPVAPPIGAQHIPDDAILLLTFSPAELMTSNHFELFPMEVFRAEAMDRIGVDPVDISDVRILVGMPNANGPLAGLAVKTSKEVSIEKLLTVLRADADAIDIDGRDAYLIPDTPGAILHQADPQTIVVSIGDWLEPLVTADNGTGQLAKISANLPRPPGVTLVAAIKPIRPMISGVLQQQVQQMPPPLRSLAQLPEFVDTLLINLNPTSTGVGMRITMLCTDDAAATKVDEMLVNAIAFGKDLGIAQAKQAAASSPQSEAVRAATLQYIDRMAATVGDLLKPVRAGRRVTLALRGDMGIATTGVMVGLLLPAVQAAREAARRMSAGNNLKQIGLAVHNYHAAYNHFPPAAITDEDGKPLLSWRVAILPFLEQQALYEKFRLDEPWDSPHNKPLSLMLPSAYIDPSVELEPGHTVFHAASGDEFMLKSDEESGFRDVIDGTSNSIMAMEVAREESVIWSKPEDIEIDLDDPLSGMGNSHQGGFHVLMGDGAVKFITNTIDPEVLKALFTSAGGEAVGAP